MIDFSPNAPKCPSCFCVPRKFMSAGVQIGGHSVNICGHCGGLWIFEGGVRTLALRALTQAEKQELRAHPRACKLRVWQDDVVAKLWG